MYDSDGMLSILDRSRRRGQARWTPLVDTKALVKKEGGNQTSYWPVGVNDSQMMCIVLKVSVGELRNEDCRTARFRSNWFVLLSGQRARTLFPTASHTRYRHHYATAQHGHIARPAGREVRTARVF